MDCRLPENRKNYFNQLYDMNLRYGVLPGLVYLYMPELAKHMIGMMKLNYGSLFKW